MSCGLQTGQKKLSTFHNYTTNRQNCGHIERLQSLPPYEEDEPVKINAIVFHRMQNSKRLSPFFIDNRRQKTHKWLRQKTCSN